MLIRTLIPVLIAAAGFAHAEDMEVSMALPDLYCKVDSFSLRKGKAPTPNFKKCDSLKDSADVKISGFEACKQRANERAADCMKRAGVDQVAVTGKYIEKFKITSNTTKFTCEQDKSGGNSCP